MTGLEPALVNGLLKAAPDAMVAVDADGLIVFANEQTARLFGYERHELLGQAIEILVPERARAVHPGNRERYVDDARHRPMGAGMALAGRRKDGTEFPAEISLSAITTESGVVVAAAVRDVTERLAAQAEAEELRARFARERSERELRQSRLESLGQLAGGVAHDFNNLLAAILSYAQLLSDTLQDHVDDPDLPQLAQAAQDVEQIRLAGDRAAALTQQLLAFGRREVVHPRSVDLGQVVTGLHPLLVRTLGSHIDLRVTMEEGIGYVKADPNQLEQVVVNLAVNARDAMPSGGTLRIELDAVDVDAAFAGQRTGITPGPHVRLRVSDTGTGMTHAVRDRAFDPFFTTKPRGEGTGLGLATVYGIITSAGGYAQIYSEPEMGTTVTAWLPRIQEVPVASPDEPQEAPTTGSERILVVEDEELLREVTSRTLSRQGYEVFSAEGGEAALEILAREPGIDLVLTDVMMPRMLGNELAERVRAIDPAIRIVFMSGYAPPILTENGAVEPGKDLIEKPFSRDSLLRHVRTALDRDGDP